jgi:hypothetical protein
MRNPELDTNREWVGSLPARLSPQGSSIFVADQVDPVLSPLTHMSPQSG